MNINILTRAIEALANMSKETLKDLPQKDLALLRKYTSELKSASERVADETKETYITTYGYGKHVIRNGQNIITVDVKDISTKRFNQKRFAAEKPDLYEAYKETSASPRMTVK